jgi:hypothetical protein
MFACGAGSWGLIPYEVICLITMPIMALEGVKLNLFFNSLQLFILCLPFFTLKNLRIAVGFSM